MSKSSVFRFLPSRPLAPMRMPHRDFIPAEWLLAVMLVLLLGGAVSPAHADSAIWEGVYKYQLKMAEHGNAEAQYKLGEMYEEGPDNPSVD